jgi:butyryl-CoA dehydrogenase
MQADESQGGMQLPYTVALACDSLFAGANISTSGYALLARGVANLLHAHGSPEQQRLFMEPILRGRFLGTMCLSEPQAGSSLADISTRAELAPEGHYLLRGSKMWISAGEHELSENIVHMVLAKIPGGPAGVKGISLFIVPRYLLNPDGSRGPANDVQLAGLNHKMGHRGIVNTVLSFGERGHCVGYLVGAPHQGLAQMFHMMNEARIGVGVGAIMSGFAGLRYSLQYAKERRQGRHPDQRDAASSPVPLIEHADVRRMLLQQKSYVEGAYCLALYAARLVDTQSNDSDAAAQREAGLLLDLLTPLVKAWSADYCVKANDVAIQVLGGYGYTREYPVEQHFRDNRLNPIHEGANGIQALDLLGRKAMQEKGAALGILARRLSATAKQADASADLAPLGAKLREALSLLLETTAQLGACLASGDLRLGLANAAHYLVLCGHTVIAWCWLQQALAAEQAIPGASPEDADYYRGKLQTCRYFFAYELPQIEPAARLLQSRERCTLDMRPEWF